MEILILSCFASAAIGALIGQSRGHPIAGAVASFFLGPIGWLLTAITDSRCHCPFCRGTIDRKAIICPHCRSSLMILNRERNKP